MKPRELLRILRDYSCLALRQSGSHLRVQCGKCFTTVPLHAGEDLRIGLLNKIEKDLASCLGEGWLRK